MISLKDHDSNAPQNRQQAVPEASPSRTIGKPIPESQTRDPRGYQIEQLKKRFSPKESTLDGGTTSLVFRLTPSDPDFPFELAHLECEVQVPAGYPEEPPVLRVRNKNIPRGFGVNVERGWDKMVQEKGGATLLALTHALDRNLESFLSEQKVETVKIVSFKDTRHLEAKETGPRAAAATPTATPPKQLENPYIPQESFTKEQIAESKGRRAQETRQIESRMGRLPQYRRSPDGIVYTLPIEPRRRLELPASLQATKTLHLIVPLLYPLQPLRIQLNEVDSEEAEPLEELFIQKAAEQKQMTLMSHLNYLAQNMHLLAKQVHEAQTAKPSVEPVTPQAQGDAKGKALVGMDVVDGDKSHIKVIPRPPEWTMIEEEDAQDSSDDYSYDSGDESDDGGIALEGLSIGGPAATDPTPERGTSISFPSIELYGIELLEVSILAISVKCERCKTVNEVSGLKNNVEKTESCRKCASALSIRFRQELVHENSTRAGFLDLSGCTVYDMLPSTFIPVCAACSSASPGIVSVRGDTVTNICRECHKKFTFAIPEVKFLAITPGAHPLPTSGPRRKQEKAAFRAGEPLPDHGACAHYKKSYRWFRFSCCGRVHPCDRCHDEAEAHVNEWASRMVCGWCGREQRFAVEACALCGRSVIGRRGKGFWEGGKGTRDKTAMSRKDKRKFRRVGGGEAKRD